MGQLRMPERTERRKRALQLVALRRGTKRRLEDSEDISNSSIFNPSIEIPPPLRSELHPEALNAAEQHDQPAIRRSARIKKKKIDGNFVSF